MGKQTQKAIRLTLSSNGGVASLDVSGPRGMACVDVDPDLALGLMEELGILELAEEVGGADSWDLSIVAKPPVVVWHLVQQRRFTPEGRADFLSFLTAASILIVGGVPHWLTFADTEGWTGTLGNVLSLGLFALAAYAGYKLNGQLKSERGRQ